ncbi:MAG: hypothetical protein LBT39_11485 [Treponema sp.]|jgi:hypothetical protein|nr:hypothetical protein [Treponema sp.]
MIKTLLLLSVFLLAPDGAGSGGGAPPLGKDALKDWIDRLNKAEKSGHKAIVEDMAKALGIKAGDAWKALKEAGWDPGGKPPEEIKPVSLRHKTPHPHYRRAGLVITNQFKTYEVTEAQLAVLKKDTWVEIGK